MIELVISRPGVGDRRLALRGGSYSIGRAETNEIVLEDNTLTVEYGARPGNCVYRGHEYSGTHSITVARNDEGDVEVEHEWVELSNGVVSVSGNA